MLSSWDIIYDATHTYIHTQRETPHTPHLIHNHHTMNVPFPSSKTILNQRNDCPFQPLHPLASKIRKRKMQICLPSALLSFVTPEVELFLCSVMHSFWYFRTPSPQPLSENSMRCFEKMPEKINEPKTWAIENAENATRKNRTRERAPNKKESKPIETQPRKKTTTGSLAMDPKKDNPEKTVEQWGKKLTQKKDGQKT